METSAVAQRFDPQSIDFIADPYPALAAMRAEAPILRAPGGYWIALSHAAVANVLRDARFGHSFPESRRRIYGPEAMTETSFRVAGRGISALNPPDHTAVRKHAVRAFSPRLIDRLKPGIMVLADRLCADAAEKGRFDIIHDLAHPLPVIVICDLLGIAEADRERFMDGSAFPARISDPAPMNRAELDDANAAFAAMEDFFTALVAQRRREPGDDLVSALVAAGGDDGLSETDIIANVVLLFAAGHETTTNLIGNGLLALHRHPDQLARLKADPALLPGAIEELLRFEPPLQISVRTALEDVVVEGVAIALGETVVTSLAAANRDPAVHDEPDRLDLSRSGLRAVTAAFGGGIHTCLGSYLARLEGEIALGALLRWFPDLAIEDIAHPQWRNTYALRGLNRLDAVTGRVAA